MINRTFRCDKKYLKLILKDRVRGIFSMYGLIVKLKSWYKKVDKTRNYTNRKFSGLFKKNANIGKCILIGGKLLLQKKLNIFQILKSKSQENKN